MEIKFRRKGKKTVSAFLHYNTRTEIHIWAIDNSIVDKYSLSPIENFTKSIGLIISNFQIIHSFRQL